MESFIPTPDRSLDFRQALGRFATGITIVTAPGPDGPVGMTVNSFASVSLDPALVLWSVDRASARFDVFSTCPHYAIHVLAEDQRALSERFAAHTPDFDAVDWTEGQHGLPLLSGCLARFICRAEARFDGGDHVILVGRVEEATQRPGNPLVFSGGSYRTLAP